MCYFLFGKDVFAKIEYEFEVQVTYQEGTVVSRNTPLSSCNYSLY